MELYSANGTPAQYLWLVRTLQVEQVTGESPASVDTAVVQTAHDGPVGADWEALVLPSVRGLLGGIPFRGEKLNINYCLIRPTLWMWMNQGSLISFSDLSP